jgi:hypothetical protein
MLYSDISVNVETESHWRKENAYGHQLADEVIRQILADNNPAALGPAIKRIVEGRVWTGVEVGFCHRLAEHLLAAG